MSSTTPTGRDWRTMRRSDFDTDAPLDLLEVPAAPLRSTGDDLLALLGVPVAAPAPTRAARPVASSATQSALF